MNTIWIESLNDSSLLDIFSHVSDVQDVCLGIRQTCRRWNRLSYDFSLWRTLNFKGWHNLTDEDFISVLDISSANSVVSTINLAHCKTLTDQSFTHIAHKCPHLLNLNISDTFITDSAFLELLSTGLKKLIFHNCRKLTWNSYLELCRNSKNLKYLGLNEFPFRENNPTRPLPVLLAPDFEEAGYQKLETLTISNCQHLTGANLTLLARSTRLTRLDMQQCSLLDDSCIQLFAKNSLQFLRIDGASLVGDESLLFLATRCTGLKHLSVSQCFNITDVGLIAIARNCRRLETLNTSGTRSSNVDPPLQTSKMVMSISDASIEEIALNCELLKCLNVSECSLVTNKSIVKIAENCLGLEYLIVNKCPKVGDEAIEAVATHCTQFRSLNAACCYRLTDRSLSLLIRRCPMSDLYLPGCVDIRCLVNNPVERNLNERPAGTTDVALRRTRFLLDYLEERFSSGSSEDLSSSSSSSFDSAVYEPPPANDISVAMRLTHVSLSMCSKVGNAALMTLADSSPHLHSLNVYDCYRVGDEGVAYLVSHCRFLFSLDVGCAEAHVSRLTDGSLLQIARHGLNLRTLNLQGIDDLSKGELSSLVNSLRLLTNFRVSMDIHNECFETIFTPRSPIKVEVETNIGTRKTGKHHHHHHAWSRNAPYRRYQFHFRFLPITESGREVYVIPVPGSDQDPPLPSQTLAAGSK